MEAAPSLMGQLAAKIPDKGIRQQLEHAMIEMLAESSMRKTELQRKGTPGVKAAEMRRAFASRAFAASWELGDIETAFERADALAAMKTLGKKKGNYRIGAVASELEKREQSALSERTIGGFDSTVGKVGFLYFLSSPSYALVNLSQPSLVAIRTLRRVTAPRLRWER